ncbi:MAG: YidC/Oxa1 family membrane protein insertase, partial [Atribacterota bacterium]|nr:YidC/Oxa1 family membrane protein insertase [Atribacterota bacterium]
MSYLFNTFLYYPILNTLVFFYNTAAVQDLGLAIILTTIVVRFILFPIYQKTIRQQVLSAKMAPEMARIQKDYKEDRERQTRELMELYKKYKVNPFYIIFAIIVQIPVFLAVWKVITAGASGSILGEGLYSFISNPGALNKMFLGIVDLSGRNMVLVVIAAIIQYAQSKFASATAPKKEGSAPQPAQPFSGNQMAFMMTGITLVILWNLPAAVAIYWITTTLFSMAQQWVVNN